jgi:hypothetical protein
MTRYNVTFNLFNENGFVRRVKARFIRFLPDGMRWEFKEDNFVLGENEVLVSEKTGHKLYPSDFRGSGR